MSERRGEAPCLLDALRRATRTSHDRLDARLPIGRELGREHHPSSSMMRALLEAFFGFYVPLEARLGEAADLIAPLPWEPRRKAHLLHADLLALGTTREAIDALPRAEDMVVIRGSPEALGWLYVVEGATLGGQVISRHLRRLGISAHNGGSFFNGYGQNTGPMWAELVARLEDVPSDSHYEEVEDRTVSAAVDLFVAFERWLDERGVLR